MEFPLSQHSSPSRALRLPTLSEPNLKISREFPFSLGSSSLPSSPVSSPASSPSLFSPHHHHHSPPLAFLNKYRQIVDSQGLLPETALFHRFLRSVKRLTKPNNEGGRLRSASEGGDKEREREGRGRMMCFMSYAWMPDKQDNDALQAKLVKIKGDLMVAGVKVMLDIHNMMGEIDKYMINGIKSSGKLLLICTPRLKERVDEHGVMGLNNLQKELQEALEKQKIDHKFIIPLILNGYRENSIASRIPNILSLDLSDPKEYYNRMTSLSPMGLLPMLLELHDNPLYSDLLSGYHAQVDLLHKEIYILKADFPTDPLDIGQLARIHRKIETHIDEVQKENQKLHGKVKEGERTREEIKELKHRLQVVSSGKSIREDDEITKQEKEGLDKRIHVLEAETERLKKEKGELEFAKSELEKRNLELLNKLDNDNKNNNNNNNGERNKQTDFTCKSGEFESTPRDSRESLELQTHKKYISEITTLKEQTEILQINHEQEIQQLKDKANVEILALQRQISDLQIQKRDSQAKLTDSAIQQQVLVLEQKRLVAELSKIRCETVESQETTKSLQEGKIYESEVNELKKKNDQLQESLRDTQKLHENEVNELKKKNNELVNWTLMIQKQEIAKDSHQKGEIENLKRQIKDMQNDNEARRKVVVELQTSQVETLNNLQKVQNELAKRTKEAEDFREEKITIAKELLGLREKNEHLRGVNSVLQKQISDSQHSNWINMGVDLLQ